MNNKHTHAQIPLNRPSCLSDTVIKEIALLGPKVPASSGFWGIPFVALIAVGFAGAMWFGPWALATGVALAAALVGVRSVILGNRFGLCPRTQAKNGRWIWLWPLGVSQFFLLLAATTNETRVGNNAEALLSIASMVLSAISFYRSSRVEHSSGSGAVAVSGYPEGELILFIEQEAPQVLLPWNRVSALNGRSVFVSTATNGDIFVGMLGDTDNRHSHEDLDLAFVMGNLMTLTRNFARSFEEPWAVEDADKGPDEARTGIERWSVEATESFTKETGLQARVFLLRSSEIAPGGLSGISPYFRKVSKSVSTET